VTGVHSVFGQVDNSTYIANILNAEVDAGTAQQVFVDADGRLGTLPTDGPGLPGVHSTAALLKPFPDAAKQGMLNLKLEKLQATVMQNQQQIETLKIRLKEQAAQIQKVNAQLEMSKPAAKVVVNKP